VPEMGVRIAMGATASEIVWLVLRQSLAMILAGVAIGTVGALAATRLLAHTTDGMRTVEPLTFAVMIPALVVAALLASFVPARRASRVDPLVALRYE
jgi:putative ABC transport system permease protein